jgi:predicted DNA-binding WGR domain protein
MGCDWGMDRTGQDLPDLRLASSLRQRWTLELRFVGGGSDKFYEASYSPAADAHELRWGRSGSAGQSQVSTIDKAVEKLREKLDKGYRLAAPSGARVAGQGGSAAPPPARAPAPAPAPSAGDQLVKALTSATQHPATVQQLSEMALTHGWQNDGDAPPDALVAFRGAEAVRLYRAADGTRWGVVRYPGGERTFARLRL